ncbi:MAG: PAS domain S-box protein [Merismopediaceae bacterium]|nr:PAS domain S-box protein [Merismopediaceae bacterium]
MIYPTNLTELRQQTAAIVIANQEGIVVEVNPAFETLTGWRSPEIIGQMISVILPLTFRDAHHLGFSRFRATEVAQVLNHPLELMVFTKDEREILSEHFILAEKVNGEWLFGAMLRPLAVEQDLGDGESPP